MMSSLNTITSGAEEYLKGILKPIVENCEYSIQSTKEFKKQFLKINGFDSENFEVVTYDCVSVYTSMNMDRVLDYILDIIYRDPLKFFPPRTKKVTILDEVITKTIEPPVVHHLENF